MKKLLTIICLAVITLPIFPAKTVKAGFGECSPNTICLYKDVFDNNQQKWVKDSAPGYVGQKYSFNIGVWNLTGAPVNNLVIKDILPSGLTYVDDSMIIYGYNGAYDDNSLFSTGINFGTISNTSSMQIVFLTQVSEYLPAGDYTLTNTANMTSSAGNKSNTASLIVHSDGPGPDSGVIGKYYNNKDLYGTPVIERIDPVIDSMSLSWPILGSPAPQINNDNFSVLWTGQVKTDYAENYTFYTNTDDGVRLWIDDQLLIDEWYDRGQPDPYDNKTIALSVGWHNIRVEYYEHGGGSIAQVFWSSTHQTGGIKTIIPQNHLRQNYTGSINSGLTGAYYDNEEMQGNPIVTRIDRTISFNWDIVAPIVGMNNEHYSIKWTGKILADYNETYTFCTRADDGTRMWIDNNLVIQDWRQSGLHNKCGNINLTSGWHDIRLDYFNAYINAAVYLYWSSPSQTGMVNKIVPTNHLNPVNGSNITLGLNASYYNDITPAGTPILTEEVLNVDFDWYMGSPDATIPVNGFSAKYEGKLKLTESGNYHFITYSDDGVRVFIDGNLVINAWQNQSWTRNDSGSITLTSGVHDIIVEYYDFAEAGGIKLMWTTPSNPSEEVIQASYFTH
mgnify:CR=1 FL=1